jgi:DNA-binding IclR family transcriptional regulator
MIQKNVPLLASLGLFTLERPVWTAEEASEALDVSLSSTYRYFASLSDAGLLTAVSPGRYMLGPSIIELDRQLQLTDPLLLAARPVMAGLVGFAPPGTAALLCRHYGDRVLCVHQALGTGFQEPVSYERGRPMPLFYGAASKAILAHLPPRGLRKLFSEHGPAIGAAGLGTDWKEFRSRLSRLRKSGVVVTRAEVDRGRIGIAAPLLRPDRHALASLSFVVSESVADDSCIRRLSALVSAAARDVEASLWNSEAIDASTSQGG